MALFRLQLTSLPSGDFAASWFDDGTGLWTDERLSKPEPLEDVWRVQQLQLPDPEDRLTPVMFNPNALAVCARVRDELLPLGGVEFLPIILLGEPYFVVHVVATRDVPSGSRYRRVDVADGNLVEFWAFPPGHEESAPLFRLRHLPDSPAGRGGFCFKHIFANDVGARAVDRYCRGYLTPLLVP